MFRFIILLACTLPPISLYYDEYFFPKWIWSIVACLVAVSIRLTYKIGILKKTHLWEWKYAATIISVSICFYAIVDSHIRGTHIHMPFENPTVLSLHLCLLLPFVYKECQNWPFKYRTLVGCIILTTLYMSHCRTGWICVALFIITGLFRKTWQRLIGLSVIILMAILLMLFVKTNSSKGRWFIIQNTIELIAQKPFTGHGYRGFQKNYMLQQRQYFEHHPESNYSSLADNINHPLNEYLYVSVNYGCLGGILLLFFIIGPLIIRPDRHNPTYYSLHALFVFSLLTYPLYYPMSWIIIIMSWWRLIQTFYSIKIGRKLGIITLFVCSIFLIYVLREDYFYRKWGQVSYIAQQGHPRAMMIHYKCLYPHFSHNPFFLYDYTINSFYALNFEEACRLSDECQNYFMTYDLTLLKGDIHYQMKDYDKALQYYQTAEFMCPVRFAPLEGMLNVYLAMNKNTKADSIRTIIQNKDIKVPSSTIVEIKRKSEATHTK